MTFPADASVVPNGTLLAYLWGLTAVALLYLMPLGAAWRLSRRLGADAIPRWLLLVISLTLSPMLLAVVLFVAGLLGVLVMQVVIGALILLAVAWRGQRGEIAAACREAGRLARDAGHGARLLAFLCLGLVLLVFLSATKPVVSHDSVYRRGHLPLAVMYAERGALPLAEWNQNFGAPHLYHMLFTALYLLRAAAGPPFLAASQTAMLALVAAAFASLWWGLLAGSIAAGIVLANAALLRIGHGPQTDVPVTLLGVASILLWARWLERRNGGLLIASSLFAGLAASTKITWWLVLPVQAALVLLISPRLSASARMRSASLFIVLPLILVLPWIVRSQLLSGTPVYPLTWRYTGGRHWDAEHDQMMRSYFADFTSHERPTLYSAPMGVPKRIAQDLRQHACILVVTAVCTVGAFLFRSVGGPVLPLLAAFLLGMLAIAGLLDSHPRHLLTPCVLGAIVASGTLGSVRPRRLYWLGGVGVVLVLLLSAVAARSLDPPGLFRFLWGLRQGRAHIARVVGRTYPHGECQLWVNEHSPDDAVVAYVALLRASTEIDFYLRRSCVEMAELQTEGTWPESLPDRMDELGVEYIILRPTQQSEPPPWWAGTWREKHLKADFEAFEPLRKAVTKEVQNRGRWEQVFGSRDWYVYRKVRAPSEAAHNAEDGHRDSVAATD